MSALQTIPHARSFPKFGNIVAKPAYSSHAILVVDDDEMVRSFLGAYFRHHGLAVWLASDGEEAVEIYQDHGAEIAIVLLDVRMPDMDGPLTLMKLREINSCVACYFMSGSWYPYTIEGLMEMGAIGLVVKPFLAKVLPQIVRECLSAV